METAADPAVGTQHLESMWRTGNHEQFRGDSGYDEPAGEGNVLLHEKIEVSHCDESGR